MGMRSYRVQFCLLEAAFGRADQRVAMRAPICRQFLRRQLKRPRRLARSGETFALQAPLVSLERMNLCVQHLDEERILRGLICAFGMRCKRGDGKGRGQRNNCQASHPDAAARSKRDGQRPRHVEREHRISFTHGDELPRAVARLHCIREFRANSRNARLRRLGDAGRAATRRQHDDTGALRERRWAKIREPELVNGERDRSDEVRRRPFELADADRSADRAAFIQIGGNVQVTCGGRYENGECENRNGPYQPVVTTIHVRL